MSCIQVISPCLQSYVYATTLKLLLGLSFFFIFLVLFSRIASYRGAQWCADGTSSCGSCLFGDHVENDFLPRGRRRASLASDDVSRKLRWKMHLRAVLLKWRACIYFYLARERPLSQKNRSRVSEIGEKRAVLIGMCF